jgi:uncharacterized protein (DUF362 family)
MRPAPDTVYLYRTPTDTITPPLEHYADLAYQALSRLDLDLPATGTVMLKPNITIPEPPDSRIIAHPGFILGMLRYLLEAGVGSDRLMVAEVQNAKDYDHWAGVSGYAEMLAPLGLSLTALQSMEGISVPVPGGVVFDQFLLFREAVECAFFFDVPVAKCHNLCCTTMAMKNLQGTVVSPQRHLCGVQEVDKPFSPELDRITASGLSLHEDRFCHKQSDMLTARRHTGIPRLSVIDGVVGRDGTAFREGQNRPLGWTLIGENEVNVDAVGTYLFGLDPERTPYLRVAAARGLGANRMADIPVVDLQTGESLSAAALAAHRSDPVLMPLCRYSGGSYARFRGDGSVVPWGLDRVNKQREQDGLELISPE